MPTFSFKKPSPQHSACDTGSRTTGFGGMQGFGVSGKRHQDPTPPTTIITHDIADGHIIPKLNDQHAALKNTLNAGSTVTLRLTNNSGLTLMPGIQNLPECVTGVEVDESCACITDFDSTLNDDPDKRTGFLRGSRGVVKIDLRCMINIKNFGHYFGMICTNLKSMLFPSSCPPPSTVTMGDAFFGGCTALEEIDLSFIQNAATIGALFLGSAYSLKALHLPFTSALTTIGDSFCHSCRNLEIVTMSPELQSASTLTAIGNGFFCDCVALQELDLSFLRHVQIIGSHFLSGCGSIQTLDMRPLTSIESFGEMFVGHCVKLRTLHLPPSSAATTVSGHFLNECHALETVDLRFIANARTIGSHFLYRCKAITTLDTSPLQHVETIDAGFLAGCDSLKSVNLSCCSKISALPKGFLNCCTSIEVLDLSPLSNILEIGNECFAYLKSLSQVHLPFGSCSKLVSVGTLFFAFCQKLECVTCCSPTTTCSTPPVELPVGDDFFLGCLSLNAVDFSFIANATHIGDKFLYDCKSLIEADTSPLKNIKSVGKYFFARCTSLKSINLDCCSQLQDTPEGILMETTALDEVDLTPLAGVKAIGDKFLTGSGVTAVHLPFTSITSIGIGFLAMCEKLQCVTCDAIPPAVVSVGNHCLENCVALQKVDLSFFTNVSQIYNNFLAECAALMHLDTTPLQNLIFVGEYFMKGCKSLKAVDLSFCSRLTIIPRGFLAELSGLETIDLTPLSQVTTVGDTVFFAIGVKSIHLAFSAALTHIGSDFLRRAQQLQTITVSPELTNAASIQTIENGFCAQCVSLLSIDTKFMGNVTRIGTIFFAGCTALPALDTTPLMQVVEVGPCFLAECPCLEEVDMGLFRNVEIINNACLNNCTKLRRVLNLTEAFSNVIEIQDGFMSGCSALDVVDFRGATKVRVLGSHFLSNCKTLEMVDVSTWTNLTHIGKDFLGGNPALTSVRLPSSLPPHLEIHGQCMLDCTALTSIDLRGLNNSTKIHSSIFINCKPEVLKMIIVPPVPKASFFKSKWQSKIPADLQQNVIECDVGDVSTASMLQWSWKHHSRHPKGVQLGVMWMFGGLQYHCGSKKRQMDHLEDGVAVAQNIPGEVAYEICRFIGSPTSELLSEQKKKPQGAAKSGFGTFPAFSKFQKK